ncbi:MAG: hypothetical protein JSV82_00780 [Planctomycetota bacterium]|nr:MAG: hypothetical protein JSV82_00780 [Planctomycetota bacterium]
MPPGKRQQSNTMLYTLVTFVALFIIATVLAVVAYLKAETYRNEATTLRNQRDDLATSAEVRKIGAIVGAQQPRKSRLGTMVDYLDTVVTLITGGVPEDTSAEVKVDTADRQVQQVLETLPQEYINTATDEPNNLIGLVRVIEKLNNNLENLTNAELAAQQQLNDLQKRFDDAMSIGLEKEQRLLAEKQEYQQLVDDIKKDYSDLKELMKQTTEEQVQTIMAQLDEERENRRQIHQGLLKTQAELTIAQNRMKKLQQELHLLVPPPDTEAIAYKPDGKVILVDNAAKIVHINLGSNDRIYRGLTFSVYDKNIPIPKDGKGKAEVEVFNVAKNISAARIIRSDIKNPVILDDIIANLIWDSERTNIFVVTGQFDLNADGETDYNAGEKIKALVEKWGGTVEDNVSIDTDFLILGQVPQVPRKPTFEEIEVDPMAMEKYEASLQKLAHYKQVQTQAQTFSIPIFNTERFLYFIGYKGQAKTPGAFEL